MNFLKYLTHMENIDTIKSMWREKRSWSNRCCKRDLQMLWVAHLFSRVWRSAVGRYVG